MCSTLPLPNLNFLILSVSRFSSNKKYAAIRLWLKSQCAHSKITGPADLIQKGRSHVLWRLPPPTQPGQDTCRLPAVFIQVSSRQAG